MDSMNYGRTSIIINWILVNWEFIFSSRDKVNIDSHQNLPSITWLLKKLFELKYAGLTMFLAKPLNIMILLIVYLTRRDSYFFQNLRIYEAWLLSCKQVKSLTVLTTQKASTISSNFLSSIFITLCIHQNYLEPLKYTVIFDILKTVRNQIFMGGVWISIIYKMFLVITIWNKKFIDYVFTFRVIFAKHYYIM